MKKMLAVVFVLLASMGYSLEFSPFVRQIVDANPQQMVEMIENTGSGTFNMELARLAGSFSYRLPYFYPYDRLDAYSARQLSDYAAWNVFPGGSPDDGRWMWDKIWSVLMVGSALIYEQSVGSYEADINRFYELASRPIDVRKSRYENDLIGFARFLFQPVPGRRARLPFLAPVPVQPPVQSIQPVSPPPPAPAPAPEVIPARIVPRMPNTGNGKVYRIQAGSYRDIEFALDAVLRLRKVGFLPAYEINGEYYRVVIPGIPASGLDLAACLLGSAGFREAWIREEW